MKQMAHDSYASHAQAKRPVLGGGRIVKDPVCGMDVDPGRAAGSNQQPGMTYYFCSRDCLEKFQADPAKYIAQPVAQLAAGIPSRQATVQPAGTAAVYTCPMHPEIVRDAPGTCSICGMALEPRTVTVEEHTNPELISMTRRFWVSVFLTAPVLLVAMPRSEERRVGKECRL